MFNDGRLVVSFTEAATLDDKRGPGADSGLKYVRESPAQNRADWVQHLLLNVIPEREGFTSASRQSARALKDRRSLFARYVHTSRLLYTG